MAEIVASAGPGPAMLSIAEKAREASTKTFFVQGLIFDRQKKAPG
jgi:hypothetical protein